MVFHYANKSYCLRVSQVVPVYPAAQVHSNPVSIGLHVPPLWQGVLIQSAVRKQKYIRILCYLLKCTK